MKEAYEDTLRNAKKIIYQWASDDMLSVLGKDWALNYMKRQADKKIFAKCIVADSEEIRQFQKMDSRHFREIKIIDAKEYPFNIELDLYGGQAAFISPKDKIAVILESPFIVKTMKAIFQLSWESLSKKEEDNKYWA